MLLYGSVFVSVRVAMLKNLNMHALNELLNASAHHQAKPLMLLKMAYEFEYKSGQPAKSMESSQVLL